MSEEPFAVRVGVILGALLVPSFSALGAPSVALPAVASGLGVPFGQTSWVLTAWALMSAVAMPLFGTLSGRIGLRTSVVIGVTLIAGGSLIAAAAPDLAVVIVGRAIGGLGAGAMVISSYATVAARLGSGDRSRALSIIAAAAAAASGSGALLGGLLAAWGGWRLVLALPALALVVLVPAARLAPVQRDAGQRLDVPGAVLVTAVGAAVVLLLQSAATGLGLTALGALGVLGALAVAALIRHVRRHPEGFVPRRVLAAPGFLSAGLVGVSVFAAYYAALYAVPTLLHIETHWGTVAVGAALLPSAAFSVLGARVAPSLVRATSVAILAAAIAGAGAAGVLIAALLPGPAVRVLGLALVTAAFAGGQAVLIGLVPQLVARRDTAAAQGLFSFIVYGGSSIGPALVGGLSSVLGLDQALAVAAVLPAAGILAALALRHRHVEAMASA